jgi:DNA invertase Pin-like site-specific DNA recombinase|nr:MAG TPA: gamma delta Resolvase, site specific recombination [Bacteriophage sp.]
MHENNSIKIGYARVSKSDGSQRLDLQKDALKNMGVEESRIYEDYASGKKDARPGLEACLKALRPGDTLVVWKLDRLGRNLEHLNKICNFLNKNHIALIVLTSSQGPIDTRTPTGKLIFHLFGLFAEYERDLICERVKAGLEAARARGHCGGRRHALNKLQLEVLLESIKNKNFSMRDIAEQFNISTRTLYNYVSPNGELRETSKRLLCGSSKKLLREDKFQALV